MSQSYDSAAFRLAQCRRAKTLIERLVEGEAAGYEVQRRQHELLRADWGAVTAFKIGCTTPVMQKFVGVDHPCAGGMFESQIHLRTARRPLPEQGRLGVECEIAVRLGQAIEDPPRNYHRATVSVLVDACMAAIELVEDRYVDYRRVGAGTLIADDFFSAGCVLGTPCTEWSELALASVTGTMWINDECRGRGRGEDILGHPLDALVWFLNHAAGANLTLQPGCVVLLGSMVQTQWLESGDQVTIEVESLGKVEFVAD